MNKLEVFSVEGKGDLESECVWLDVKEDIPDLSKYLLCDTTYSGDGRVSNELRHTYWFPRMSVKKGDYLKLMTKPGQYSKLSNKRQTTTHVLWWGVGRTIWNQAGDCAVLFKCEGFTFKPA